ncbi:MAG: hypothetical protein KJZ78_21430 [Bryobacteraceae bacterium]|nr:hypothetical protein [Bryobacteraceae bacterium]
MGKKQSKKNGSAERPGQIDRTALPEELNHRLHVVWSKLGHLIEWCDSSTAWTEMFFTEARPYRQTFYWEAVAEHVADNLLEHSATPPERALTDCLIATQYAPSPGDSERLTYFREAWQRILDRSRHEIEAFVEADLALGAQEGTLEAVARLYAAECGEAAEATRRP